MAFESWLGQTSEFLLLTAASLERKAALVRPGSEAHRWFTEHALAILQAAILTEERQ